MQSPAFSMSLDGRVHISDWELSTLKLLHFEQFTLQCHLVDMDAVAHVCNEANFHVMITCPASFNNCKFVFGILFAAPSSVSMRIQVYFQGVLGGLCLDNQFTFKCHLLDECAFLFWKCLH